MGAWITTYGGRHFYVLEPRAEDVHIEDIAHALSLQCRFTGHVREFYSVAQHSVLVSRLCAPADAFWGLLHDASEAYIGDMSAPLKHTDAMRSYKQAESAVMRVIGEQFRMRGSEPQSVITADRRLLLTEARALGLDVTGWYTEFTPFDIGIDPWPPKFAETAFLERFRLLNYFRQKVGDFIAV